MVRPPEGAFPLLDADDTILCCWRVGWDERGGGGGGRESESADDAEEADDEDPRRERWGGERGVREEW